MEWGESYSVFRSDCKCVPASPKVLLHVLIVTATLFAVFMRRNCCFVVVHVHCRQHTLYARTRACGGVVRASSSR